MMRSMLIIAPIPAGSQPRPPRLPRPKASPAAEPPEQAIAVATISPTAPAVESADAAEATPQRVIRTADPERLQPLWSVVPELASISPTEPQSGVDSGTMQVATRFADSVRSVYPEASRLRGVYLIGERAAGSARAGAEVETVIVLDFVERYGVELERTSHLVAALSHELNVVVSRVFVPESEWLDGNGALAAVRAAAVAL